MRTKKSIAAFTLFFLLQTNSLAFFGGAGGIVSDPTSYTYYAQQIKSMNDSIKTALDQLDQLNKVNDAMNEANKLIFESGERIYNPARSIQNLMNNLQNTEKRFESLVTRASNMGMERFFKEYHNVNEPLKDEDYVKFQERFRKLFGNNDDATYQKLQKDVMKSIESGNYEAYRVASQNLSNYLTLKGIEREQLRRAALLAPTELHNEYFLNADAVERRNQKKQTVKDLIRQTQEEKDLLKQTQTTNQIMLELLEIAQGQYEMQMQFFNAVSLALLSDREGHKEMDAQTIEKKKDQFANTSGQVVDIEDEDIKKWIESWGRENEKISKETNNLGGWLH